MEFEEADNLMKEGKKVRRKFWSFQFTKFIRRGIGCYNNSDGGFFLLSPVDIDAMDWEEFKTEFQKAQVDDWNFKGNLKGVLLSNMTHPGEDVMQRVKILKQKILEDIDDEEIMNIIMNNCSVNMMAAKIIDFNIRKIEKRFGF